MGNHLQVHFCSASSIIFSLILNGHLIFIQLYDVDYAIVSTLEFVHILMVSTIAIGYKATNRLTEVQMAEGSGFKNSLGFWLVKNKPRIKILTSTDNVKCEKTIALILLL